MSLRFQAFIIASLYCVLLGTICIYWPGLTDTLILDDASNLEDLLSLSKGFTYEEVIFNNVSGIFGRPISIASFVLNYISSGLIIDFKKTNLAIHLLTGLLIFWTFGRLLSEKISERESWFFSIIVTSLWLSSPMFTSTVLYVVQRMAQLAAFFSFLGLLLYTLGRQNIIYKNAVQGWILISIVLFIIWPLAILSKENGILLGLFLLLIESNFFQYKGIFVSNNYKRLFHGSITIIFVGLLLISYDKFISILANYEYRNFTLYERILTESRVLIHYIKNLIIPNSNSMGVIHDDFEISKGLFTPITTFLSIVSIIALVVFSYVPKHTYTKIAGFGILFFFLGHLLESTIFPLEIYFEHRNYLSSPGIYLSVVALGVIVYKRYKIIAILLLLPVLFMMTTYQRAIIWSNEELLVTTMYESHPNSIRASTFLSKIYLQSNKSEKALAILNELYKNTDLKFAAGIHILQINCYYGYGVNQQILNELIKIVNNSNRNLYYIAYEINSVAALSKTVQNKCANWHTYTELRKLIFHWANNLIDRREGRSLEAILVYSAQLLYSIRVISDALYLLEIVVTNFPENKSYRLLFIHYLINGGFYDEANKELDLFQDTFHNLNEFHRGYYQQLSNFLYQKNDELNR